MKVAVCNSGNTTTGSPDSTSVSSAEHCRLALISATLLSVRQLLQSQKPILTELFVVGTGHSGVLWENTEEEPGPSFIHH